jgi:hypothetical protein
MPLARSTSPWMKLPIRVMISLTKARKKCRVFCTRSMAAVRKDQKTSTRDSKRLVTARRMDGMVRVGLGGFLFSEGNAKEMVVAGLGLEEDCEL